MKSSIEWLILIAVTVTCLIWAIHSQSTSPANNEYRTCVHLVKSGDVASTVDACKVQRDLMRSLG